MPGGSFVSSWTKTRSEIAHAKKRDPDADVTELRQRLKAEKLEDHIAGQVNTWPALTPAQLHRLSGLLRPTAGGGADPPVPGGSAARPQHPVEERRRPGHQTGTPDTGVARPDSGGHLAS